MSPETQALLLNAAIGIIAGISGAVAVLKQEFKARVAAAAVAVGSAAALLSRLAS
jgi:hypothetical protein